MNLSGCKRQLKNDIIVFDDYTMSQFNEIVQLVNEIEKKKYFVKKIHSDQRAYAIAYKL